MTTETNPKKRSTAANIFYIFFAIISIFIGMVVMQPNDFRITRSLAIKAEAPAVFSQINNLHNFNVWNPWAKIDPNSKVVFEGAEEGVGAIMRWDGNNEVGSGSMTNVENRANEFVKFKMEFLKPMQSTSTTEFTLTNEANQTVVTWSMYGQNNFIGKAMGLIMNCDKMVGGQFEKGLENLKSIVETK